MCQLDAQSDPKSLPKWTSGRHFLNFCANKATLHPTQYLLWFCYILGVSGPLFFDHFVEKGAVNYEPYKITLLELDFSRFLSKMYQNWDPKGGGKTSPNLLKIRFCLQGVPLGSPGEPKATKMEPKGAKMTPRGPQNDFKYTVLGSKVNATNRTTKKNTAP